MSQPAGSTPSSTSRVARPIAAKPSTTLGADTPNSSPSTPATPHTMASARTIATSHGANTSASAAATSGADTPTTRPQFTFQFSAATEMILKRLRGEGGLSSPSSTLGIRTGGATTGVVQPPGYEDVRRSVLEGMKTTLNINIPPVIAKKNSRVATARMATPAKEGVITSSAPAPAPAPAPVATSVAAPVSASVAAPATTSVAAAVAASAPAPAPAAASAATPAGGSAAGKTKPTPKSARSKAGTKRKRARDDSDSTEESAALSDLGGDSDSDGNGSVTNMPKQTLSGRKVVKPAQFNPAAVEGPARKRGPYNYKRPGRSVEQALCKRCGRGHSPTSNMIVFCDGCNSGWHQMCHDPMVSDEAVKDESKEWFCNDCALKRARARISMPEAGSDSAWLGKSLDEKRAYLLTFPQSHLVSLLLQATTMHPDIPIFPDSNPSPLPTQHNASRTAERRVNIYPQQPFPPSSASTAGLFSRAEANPGATINFIRKIIPSGPSGASASPSSTSHSPFITSFDHSYRPGNSPSASNPNPTSQTSSVPFIISPTMFQSQQSNPTQAAADPADENDAEGDDESRASTPASPPYPRPGNGLMAKLPPDDQDLEWLVGEGEDDAAFSHLVFNAQGEAQKVDERGRMPIAGQV